VQSTPGLIHFDVGSLDAEPAAVRHGVACVHHEIDDDLSELARVDLHGTELGCQDRLQQHVFADQPRQHLAQRPDEVVEIEDARLDDLPAREREQLSCEIGAFPAPTLWWPLLASDLSCCGRRSSAEPFEHRAAT
jgi:hypothetical protein